MNKAVPLLIALALLFASAFTACKGETSPEDEVKLVVERMAEAAEAKDIGELKGYISKSYKDPAGNDYEALKGIILLQFVRSGSINVYIRRQDVEIRGDKAYDTVRALVTRGGPQAEGESGGLGAVIPEDADGFVFDLTFVRDDGDWLMSSAIWRQVGVGQAM